MVVEVDLAGGKHPSGSEISDMPFKNLVDIELSNSFSGVVATMCRIKRTQIVIRFTVASGVIINRC